MKNNSTGKIISNSIIYTICGLVLKCFNFFLLPLYTSYLSTSDYGITNISGTFVTTMGFIVSLSLFSAVLRFYVDLKKDSETLKRFYGTVVLFVFLSGIIVSLFLFVFKQWVCRFVFDGIDFYPIVFISIISLIFSCQQHIYENILKSQQKAWKYVVVVSIYFAVNLLSNLFFVVHMQMGAIGALLSTALANVSYTLFFMIDMICTKSIRFCLDFSLLKDALKYSIPIVPHDLSTRFALLISQILIGSTKSFSALGIYSVAAQFGSIADIIQVYVNNAYCPWLFEVLHSKEKGYKNMVSRIVPLLCCVMGFFFICISLFAHDYIVLFVDSSFVDAWRYIPLIVTVYSAKTAYYFYVSVILYYKEASKFLFIATFSGSLLNILLSYVFIPLYGAYGSIMADAISMLVRVLIIIIISKKYEDTGIRIKDFIFNFITILVFIYGGLSLSYIYFNDTFSIINLLFKFAVLAIYLGLVLVRYNELIIPYAKNLLHKTVTR